MIKRNPIVMIPGPTPVDDSILKALSRRTSSHTHAHFTRIYKEALDGLKEIMMTDGEVVAVGGSGTLAMEMAIVNTLKKGDNLLVVNHGMFGSRFIDIAGQHGINVDSLTANPGEIVNPEQIKAKLQEKNYQAITVTHVDTSTGTCAPVEEISKVVRRFPDTLFILDGVCATGGIEENMKDWGIDVIVTTTQKAIGVPPGVAICGFSPKALERKKSLGAAACYYCDIDNWLPVMNDPAKYFATPPINLIEGLNEGVKIILAEGLKERFARHQVYGKAFQEAIKALGLNLLTKPANTAPTMSAVLYPAGVNDVEFRSTMIKYGIVVAGGLGAFAGKMFRIGHMGNITHQEIFSTIVAIELSLKETGYPVSLGMGVAAAEAVISAKTV